MTVTSKPNSGNKRGAMGNTHTTTKAFKDKPMYGIYTYIHTYSPRTYTYVFMPWQQLFNVASYWNLNNTETPHRRCCCAELLIITSNATTTTKSGTTAPAADRPVNKCSKQAQQQQ